MIEGEQKTNTRETEQGNLLDKSSYSSSIYIVPGGADADMPAQEQEGQNVQILHIRKRYHMHCLHPPFL